MTCPYWCDSCSLKGHWTPESNANTILLKRFHCIRTTVTARCKNPVPPATCWVECTYIKNFTKKDCKMCSCRSQEGFGSIWCSPHLNHLSLTWLFKCYRCRTNAACKLRVFNYGIAYICLTDLPNVNHSDRDVLSRTTLLCTKTQTVENCTPLTTACMPPPPPTLEPQRPSAPAWGHQGSRVGSYGTPDVNVVKFAKCPE